MLTRKQVVDRAVREAQKSDGTVRLSQLRLLLVKEGRLADNFDGVHYVQESLARAHRFKRSGYGVYQLVTSFQQEVDATLTDHQRDLLRKMRQYDTKREYGQIGTCAGAMRGNAISDV